MLPSLARRIVEEYSKPDGLVLDPMCGTGTTLAEAAAVGRRAVGIESEDRWATLAKQNLDHVLSDDRRLLPRVRKGDARELPRLLGDMAGTVDLVCTSPPYAYDTGNLDKSRRGAGGGLCSTTTRNYSPPRTNLGQTRGTAYERAMAEIYGGCFEVLRPGGLLVVVTQNTRRKGGVFDLVGTTVSVARSVGFTYLQHVVALHASVRDGSLIACPSFWQRNVIQKALERGEPRHLLVHEDVSVLRKPPSGSEIARAQ
jgi:DNA modification methylase